MKPEGLPPLLDTNAEISALIEALHRTEQRLDELTAGEVDSITDRHGRTFLLQRAQEQSREREAAKQAGILNALPAHIALLDTQGQIIMVNEAWRQFGEANTLHAPGYAVGINYLKICDTAEGRDADEAGEAAAGIRAVLRGESQRFSLEYPCHAPTEERWFLMTVTPLSNEHRNGAVVMHLNITERRQTEAAHKRLSTELRVLFDLMPAMIWFKDTENGILRVNQHVAEAAGKSVEEIEGKPTVEIYPENAAKYFVDDLEVIDSGLPKLGVIETIPGPDGEQRWVETDKVPYHDPDGKVIGLVVMAQDITERKRVEAEATRLLSVLEASLNEIYIFDANTLRFDYVNDSARRNLGYTMENMRQLMPLDFKPEFTEASFDELIEPLRRHEKPKIVFKTVHRRADGSLYPVEVHLQLVEHVEKPVFLAVINDITERKRAEDALRESEAFNRSIIESSPDCIKVLDLEGNLLSMLSGQALLGIEDIQPYLHTSWIDFWEVAEHREAAQRAVKTGTNGLGNFVGFFPTLRGEPKWWDVSISPILDANRQPERLLAVSRDVTLRKQAEEALRTSMEEFRTLAESMPQIVWITRADRWTIYLNRQWMEYTGRTLEESLGQGWLQSIHLEEQQQVWEAWQKATETGGIYSVESRLQRADGVYRWWLVRGVPQLDASGKTLKWFGTCTDIHDLKIAELEITQNNQALRQSEVRIRYLNRVYAMLSGINTLIVRVRDRDELFREACRVAVGNGGFRMSLICILDRVTMKIVPVASAGKDEALMNSIEALLASSDGAQNTMVARAIRESKVIVSNESENDPQAMLRNHYIESGVNSIAVFPLIVADVTIGAIALYAPETEFFHEEELKLLADLTEDISFGIDHIDKQERLDYLAYYDVLTGLANRTLFHERLEQGVINARARGDKLALVLVDIERFKTINDTFGRPAGDILLKAVASRISGFAVDVDRLGRLDADHFAVMVLEVQSEQELAGLVEQRLAEVFGTPFRIGNSDLRLSAKIGIAMYPTDGADADELFRNAEAALKNTKTSGEQCLFYTQTMNARVAEKLTLENQLRQALDNGEFVLHYQPKINLVSGELTSAEALIRWNDPRTGLVPPGKFIPILEETGLINEVGRWALRQAIEDYRRWCSAGLAAVRIAVNVSPLQLRHRGFVTEIEQALGTDIQAAAGLELEITESLIMENVEHSIESLNAIRALGIMIAIDDFGTGFSSLSYLAKLPVDTLKIDRSFVVDMTGGPEGLALVATIINLAHSLKLKVVAEGVETEEQSRLLRLLDCDEMQGFLFSKAVPVDIFESSFLTRIH